MAKWEIEKGRTDTEIEIRTNYVTAMGERIDCTTALRFDRGPKSNVSMNKVNQ